MSEEIAVVAARASLARAAALRIARRFHGPRLWPASLDGYLSRPDAPRRVVLCAGPGDEEQGFLRRAAARLLWPAPPEDFSDAIGGLLTGGPERLAASRPARSASGAAISAALLLEGLVDAARARAALRASATRDWIVESVVRVRLTDRRLDALRRAGVRWSALEPVELVAVAAPRAYLRGAWRKLLPARTPVWATDEDEEAL